MRVLLLQNMRYLPSHGGANRSNRLLLEELAARGHRCTVVAPLAATTRTLTVADLLAELAARGVTAERVTAEAVVFRYCDVQVHVVIHGSRLAGYARALAAGSAPDRVLVPSDDPGQLMLAAALRAAPDRVVYLVHTLQQLPFGPRAFYPSGTGAAMVRRCAGVVAVSRAAQSYLSAHADLASTLIHPPVYGPGPFPALGRAHGPVLVVNPCLYKGLSIVLSLADACPDVPFQAVPTWGTTGADRAALRGRPNVTLAEPVDDLPELLAGAGAVLMPSLWDETFGYTAVEAMLHGVPVLASDVGGLSEAKLGVPYLLPVRPITGYRPQTADEPFPEPVVPEQDVQPWLAALRRLRADADHHARLAAAGQEAAAAFVAGLDPAGLESYLSALTPAAPQVAGAAGADPDPAGDDARRAALARVLARRRAEAGQS